MKFLFDCEDKILLPRAYQLIDDIKPFIDKMKTVDVPEDEVKTEGKTCTVLKNMMVHYPEETGALLAKLWILDKGEKAPNALRTVTEFVKNNEAIDFFTSALPFLVQMSNALSRK